MRLGGLSFQSVELLKFAVVVWLAGVLAAAVNQGGLRFKAGGAEDCRTAGRDRRRGSFIQSDFGSGVVMLAMMAVMMTVRRAYAAFVLIGLVIGAALLLAIAVTPYRRDRLQAYLHPATSNCSQAATGYQA